MKVTIIICALGLYALEPTTRAVDPPPDGGYPGGNTAEGNNALFSLTTGQFNTAIGTDALGSNTSQTYNTAVGYRALYNNRGPNAFGNTAIGAFALDRNTKGRENTATGLQALFNNTIGKFNTANGNIALLRNTTANRNTATGHFALCSNTVGDNNTADGESSLLFNTTGQNNTAQGHNALRSNSTGSHNIGVGAFAGVNLTTGSNNIDIFDPGVAGEENTIRIGTPGAQSATFIAGIRGAKTAAGDALPVVIDSAGQLHTSSSSARFKNEIKAMDKTSEAILALKPVVFHYKGDVKGTPQFGLIAEQVAKVNPELVVRDEKGEIYTVRYDAVNAMLLNEFLKEHRNVKQLEATVAKQQNDIAALTSGLKAQAAQIQQVSNQLELGKNAAQVVASNQ